MNDLCIIGLNLIIYLFPFEFYMHCLQNKKNNERIYIDINQ
jgi:hypothetical protein